MLFRAMQGFVLQQRSTTDVCNASGPVLRAESCGPLTAPELRPPHPLGGRTGRGYQLLEPDVSAKVLTSRSAPWRGSCRTDGSSPIEWLAMYHVLSRWAIVFRGPRTGITSSGYMEILSGPLRGGIDGQFEALRVELASSGDSDRDLFGYCYR